MLSAEEADLFSESLTFEVKEKMDKRNVAEAVAALSNTDGGRAQWCTLKPASVSEAGDVARKRRQRGAIRESTRQR